MIYINNKEKLNIFKDIIEKEEYFVITDFDRTLTTHASDPSMGIIPNYLGGECKERRTKIFKKYRPIELDYTLEPDEKKKLMRKWAEDSFLLLSEYVSEDVVKKSLINANLHLREGTKILLEYLNSKSIPVVVMSSGIGNIVEGFLEKENCLLDNVYLVSNFFEFENGKTKIDLSRIMATSNKEYDRIPVDIRNKIEKRKNCILFGDLVEDLRMINEDKIENVLKVGFLDENIETNLEAFNNSFDIVITNDGDFNDIIKILKEE